MEEELSRKTFTELPDPPILESDDFEFAFTLLESDASASTETTAGEIFPVYPIFNRSLVAGCLESSAEQELAVAFEKHDLRSGSASSSSSTSSEADDPATYCVWTPRSAQQSPDRWRMSQSTGSDAFEVRRFRIRDLIFGRSRSDGKEKVMVVPNPNPNPNPSHRVAAEGEKKRKMKGKGKEMDVVTAYELYYGKGAAVGQQSFLPYREGLLGGFRGNWKRRPL